MSVDENEWMNNGIYGEKQIESARDFFVVSENKKGTLASSTS